jgi:hypothetical protein
MTRQQQREELIAELMKIIRERDVSRYAAMTTLKYPVRVAKAWGEIEIDTMERLAGLVDGLQRVRDCDICKKPLDVTGHNGSKRVHEKCSLRERMRRYREKLRAADHR